jgi:hypothetical protein
MSYPNEAGRMRLVADQPIVLSAADRELLVQTTQRHIDELLAEAARTESRPMQHELAGLIDRLQAVLSKVGGGAKVPVAL